MKFSDIKLSVEELADGRVLDSDKQKRWIKRVRNDDAAMDPQIRGFDGLYFLYKEAEVEGGSKANEPRYAMPNDYIIGLNVFYNEKLLLPAPPRLLDITVDKDETAEIPTWVRLMGTEFDIRPIPEKAGDTILLLYCGMPDVITSNDTEDYFMAHFANYHIFGMGTYANLNYRNKTMADYCRGLFEKERTKLMLHNRNHYINNIHIRFQNFDEYQEKRTILYPQFLVE